MTLDLPAELTIYTVGELHRRWLAWLADAGPATTADDCRVDGSAVDQVDAAGLQLLVALMHSLARQQRTSRVHAASPALSAGCQALGLSALLCATETTGAAA